jgi:hypothetical protein
MADASNQPTGFLVLNTETEGWKMYPTRSEALSLCRKFSQLRMFPVWGEFEVDRKFLDFARWAVAA